MLAMRRILVLSLLLVGSGTAFAQPIDKTKQRDSKEILQLFRSVVAKSSDATVRVLADGKEVAFGTVTGADGWILTKWDEIKNKAVSCKLKNGEVLTAKIVGFQEDYDLAMLKVEPKEPLPVVQWRSSKDATVGKWVASVSVNPDPVAVGVVSVASRPLKLGDQPPKRSPGPNSGFLGIQLAPGNGGAKIAVVNPKGPADKAGLKKDDLITEASGKKILDDQSFIEMIQRLKAGDSILLKVVRGDEELELKATLGKVDLKQLGVNPQETMGTKLSLRRGGFPVILQHDSGLRPEDCGGPLVDLDGKVVGINIARAGRTETYAIPSDAVRDLLADLMSGNLAHGATVAKVDPPKKDITKSDPPKKDPVKTDPPKKEILDANVLLKKTLSLTVNDKFDKNRPNMKPNRHFKVEEVKMTAGTKYTIEMDSAEIDSFLILEDAKETMLASDDDGGGFPNAKLEFTPKTDGTYRVIMTTFESNDTGAFTLTIRKEKSTK